MAQNIVYKYKRCIILTLINIEENKFKLQWMIKQVPISNRKGKIG